MAKKQTLEDEVNAFLESWDADRLTNFLRDIIPLFELFNVEDEGDWVTEAVGEENERNVRMIRTVYLVSRIAEFHAGKLCSINVEFRNLWKRLEKAGLDKGDPNGQEDKEITERHEEFREARSIIA